MRRLLQSQSPVDLEGGNGMRKAVRLARSEKPGACLIELPEDADLLGPGEDPLAPGSDVKRGPIERASAY